jgi:putative endonuclease
MSYLVYILYSEGCDKFYIGHTDNIDRRIDEHNQGKGGKFSSTCFPWKLMLTEEYPTRSEAMKRELEIKKKKRRTYVEWLINKKG